MMIEQHLKATPITLATNLSRTSYVVAELLEAEPPLPQDTLSSFRLIDEDLWPLIWRADLEPLFRASVEEMNRSQGDYFDRLSNFQAEMNQCSQTLELPHTYLWRMEQLRSDLFPVMAVQSLETDASPALLRRFGESFDGHNPPNQIEYRQINEIVRQIRVEKVKQWLQSLPVASIEEVYLSPTPQHTLVVPWGLFVENWNIFYHQRWCTLNIVDSDPRWFLFMHMEKFAYWGCTEEFAQEGGGAYSPNLNCVVTNGDAVADYKVGQRKVNREWAEDVRLAISKYTGLGT